MSNSRNSLQNTSRSANRETTSSDFGSTTSRQHFNTIAELATELSGCAHAFIALTPTQGGTVLGSTAGAPDLTPLMPGLFENLREQDAPDLWVPDVKADVRLSGLAEAMGGVVPGFLAGAVMRIEGQIVGVICVLDPAARPGTEHLRTQLQRLAALATSLLTTASATRLQRDADLARQKAEFRHSLALHAASIASWMWHIKPNSVTTDQTLRDWVDIDLEGGLSMQELLVIVHPDDIETVRVALDMSLVENVDFHCEFRTRSNGKWLMGQGRVYERDREGQPASMAGVFLDISKTKQAEATTRLLLRELDHRVKNTLAVLQSLAAQTLKSAQSPEQFMRAFSGRLQALAATHTLLSEHPLHRVPIQSLLKTLIGPYADRFEDQVEIAGDDVAVGPDEALGLGLVLHELATNAARHGALSAHAGKLAIRTEAKLRNGAATLDMHWQETGGPEVPAAPSLGLGSVLINRGLQKILESHVETRLMTSGAEAHISFPLPEDTKS